MKTLKITALLLFATATISAQDLSLNDVPENLQTTFSSAYNNASDVEWEKKGEHYKVEFEIDRLDHDVWYDASGNVVKSQIEISESELPSAVASAIKGKYADYKIDSVEVHEENSTKTYEVEIEKGWTHDRTLVLDSSGSIISDIDD